MKDKYIWDYTIKIKTNDGEYEYEKETLENLKEILEKHKDYTEVSAKRENICKKKVLKKH